VGIESGVMNLWKSLLVAAVATSLLFPAAAFAATSAGKKAHRTKITVHPKYRWRGYGFLPGYRPWVNDLDRRGRSVRREGPEMRYWHYGQLNYGWGRPGFYRGRWNGGSFGPCWTSTPIGMMPTCGQ
jgi:GNAT superfamily N-acetyltransferase